MPTPGITWFMLFEYTHQRALSVSVWNHQGICKQLKLGAMSLI